MGIEEFSFVYATALAVVAVGVVALLFGQCMMMGRIGRHWWQGLVPGYNLYLLFSGARLQLLFLVYLACAVACYGFWVMEEPEIQDLIWIPIALGVLIIMYVSLALAQRMHLGIGWQIVAFLVPSYAWVLIGLMGVRVDDEWYPWTVRPFVRLEHCFFRHRPWEFDRKTGRPFGYGDEELPGDDEFEDEFEDGEPPVDELPVDELPEGVGDFDGEEPLEGEGFVDAEDVEDFEYAEDAEADASAEADGVAQDEPAKPRGRRLRRHHTMAMERLEPQVELESEPEPELEPEPEPEPEPARDDELGEPETTPVPLGEDAGIDAPSEAPASLETEVHTMGETAHDPTRHEETPSSEPAFHGGEFDPVGDAGAEAAAERGADREIEDFVDEEAELADMTEATGGVQDDDLSDEVNSRLEGIYAEELGFPGVTQAVDDEEAVYMESDASIAREEILEETHDEPNPTGYQARHLAALADGFEAEETARKAAEDSEFKKEKASYEAKHTKAKPKPKHAAPPKNR